MDLIDETIEELPLEKKIEMARMDGGDIRVLQQGLGRYIAGIIDSDPDDLHDVIIEMWKRLRETHGLRVIK